MSRKHKKTNPAGNGRQAVASTSLLSILAPEDRITAADGYSNAAAFLGKASALLSAGTFLRSNLTANQELLTTMYRENWICKRIIDMPTEDMTRAWYTLTGDFSEEERDLLTRLEAKHSVKQEIANAIRWARLYGGSLAVMVIRGDEDSLSEPLDLDLLLPDCFQGLLVLDRTQGITPSLEKVADLDDPDFGLPMYYDVSLNLERYKSVRIHHSRVLRFIGRELPATEMEKEDSWGASEMEHIYDELQKHSSTSSNIAQLVFQANITTLKIADFGEALGKATDKKRRQVLEAMEQENRFRTSYGIQLLSAGDSLETHSYSFTGLSDIYDQFMLDMSGAAEIPATKLFGRSPQGLNATGESDLKNYYEMIAQMQERILRPALERLLPVMALSCWGDCPPDLNITFEPLMTTTPEARADLIEKNSRIVLEAFTAGLITREEAIRELKARGTDLGAWTMLQETPLKSPQAPEENQQAG